MYGILYSKLLEVLEYLAPSYRNISTPPLQTDTQRCRDFLYRKLKHFCQTSEVTAVQ